LTDAAEQYPKPDRKEGVVLSLLRFVFIMGRLQPYNERPNLAEKSAKIYSHDDFRYSMVGSSFSASNTSEKGAIERI
jgi:hypothetical protein